MGGFFPFFGFNLVFWIVVGFVRFISEHAYTKLGVGSGIAHLKRFAQTYMPVIEETFGVVGVMVGCVSSFVLLVFFVVVTGAIGDADVSRSLTAAYSSIAAWAVFSAVAGYMASRVELDRSVSSGMLAGIFYWALGLIVVLSFSGVPRSLADHDAQALLYLLLLSMVFSLLGATAAVHVNLDDERRRRRARSALLRRIMPSEVAAIVPAHNEEKTIAKTIESLSKVIPPENIHIGSDASDDRTVDIARTMGAQVADIRPNRGKANVLRFLIDEYRLTERFRAVMIVDADSEVSPEYLENALPIFDDSDIVAVAVHALSRWDENDTMSMAGLIRSYRVRFYRVLQATLRYGQAWKYMNSMPIIPGFASIYRSEALAHISVNAPGLVIEDFNMTFEVYHKKLGKVAYSPGIHAVTRDPLTLKDYYRQVKRWNLGLWQTLRRHGFWPSFFSVAFALFIFEMLFTSIFIVLIPFLILALLIYPAAALAPFIYTFSLAEVTAFGVMLFFVIDYLMTVAVALYERKPALLVNGPAFFILRFIDAFTFLYTLPLAFFARSDGRWVSPER